MSPAIVWTTRAQRDLKKKLDAATRGRIRRALHRLAEIGHGDVKKLQGHDAIYRLRVGSYRIFFTYTDSPVVLLVLRVMHRRDAY